MEFMAQIQEQSELSNSTIENLKENFEIHDAITLESGIEVGTSPKTSKPIQNMDEQLLFEEEEDDKATTREEPPLPFFIPKQEESEKDIVEALSKVQSDIPILGTPNQVPDCVEVFKEPCSPRRMIQEKVVAGEYQEFIKENVVETIKSKEVEFDDTGQIITIVVNLAKFKVLETFKEVAPTLEFQPLPDHFKYHLPFKDQFHAMGPRGA
ncbi:hypothetical protein PS1_023106 [Malus domestica]